MLPLLVVLSCVFDKQLKQPMLKGTTPLLYRADFMGDYFMQLIRPASKWLFASTLCLSMWACGEPPADSPVDTVSSSDGMTDASINGASDATADATAVASADATADASADAAVAPDMTPDVVISALEVNACVIVTEDTDAECISELVLDWGSIAPGDSASGEVQLTNVGTLNGQLDSIEFQYEEMMVTNEWLNVIVLSGTDPTERLPLPIEQMSTLRVLVHVSEGLSPGALPIDTLVVTLSSETDEEITLNISIVGMISQCAVDTASCDSDWTNGCETETLTDRGHCGGCDAACSVVNGTVVCDQGVCVPTCDRGWDGGTCETNTIECDAEISPCEVNAACADTEDAWTCACNTGYSGDGVTCTNIDECTLDTDNCDVNAACTDTEGAWTCACNTGYSGDGVTCTNVDECVTAANNCDENASCIDTEGAWTCDCNTGYSGNGVTCVDVDECAAADCGFGGRCTEVEGETIDGQFTCICEDGFIGGGVNGPCADLSECLTGPQKCAPVATCMNLVGDYECSCNLPWEGDGVICTQEIQIGDGTRSISKLPLYGLYDYSQSTMLYLSEELWMAGADGRAEIIAIAFECSNWRRDYVTRNQTIKMFHTELTEFRQVAPPNHLGLNFYDPITVKANFTLSVEGNGWLNINFDQPFSWDGHSNLAISWENRDGDWQTGYGYLRGDTLRDRHYVWYEDRAYPSRSERPEDERPNLRMTVQSRQ